MTYSHTPILPYSHTCLSAFPPPKPVIPIYIDHQRQQEHHADHLRVFKDLLTGFATGNHFQYGKEHMSPIQRRYRQDIHKGQRNREECSDGPERLPVPHRRENGSHSFETTHPFIGFCFWRKYFFELADITSEFFNCQMNTCRERTKKAVFCFFDVEQT